MSIQQREYDNENELHKWVEENILKIFGEVLYLPGNFFISTKRNKGGKPDGYILDLVNSSWVIVESELLKHGIWDHIAEQIIRFIVAAKNDETKRIIRDKFFEQIDNNNQIDNLAQKLKISSHRLLQYIENILENNTPEIAVFIDEKNEDLEDVIEALNVAVKVYKVQKYIVNGSVEYLLPSGLNPTIETTVEEVQDSRGNVAEAIELLGGGKLVGNTGRLKAYTLSSGDVISIKYSKYYDVDSSYWYGITPNAIEKYNQLSVTHIAFIIGDQGVIKLPYSILKEYFKEANTTLNPDGSIKHYHVFIKDNPKYLYTSRDRKTFNVEEFFFEFE